MAEKQKEGKTISELAAEQGVSPVADILDLAGGVFDDDDDVEEFIAAAEGNRSIWQPIETAPKDGTKILVWNGYRRCLSYCDEFGWHRQNFIGEPLGSKDYEPETHWTPLPDPPC